MERLTTGDTGSDALYRVIYDSLPDMLCSIDLETKRIVSCNQTYLENTGFTREETIGKPVIEAYHPDCREKVPRLVAAALETGRLRNEELELLRRDGSKIPVTINVSVLRDAEGRPAYSNAVWRDISDYRRLNEIVAREQLTARRLARRNKSLRREILERRDAEAQGSETKAFLESIVQNIPDMIFVKDAEHLRFVELNRAGEKLLGFAREDLIGKNDFDFFPAEQAEFFTQKDRDVLAGAEPVIIERESIDTRHKGRRWLNTRKVPVLSPDGVPLYLLGISTDITERLDRERELLEQKAELEKANRLKDEFLANMSHELRTPLNSVIGFSSVLLKNRKQHLDEEELDRLMKIRTNGERLLSLIEGILDLSRIESGAVTLNYEQCSLEEEVRGILDELASQIADKQVACEVHSLVTEPLRMVPDRLRQIIRNLLENAIKFVDADNGRVSVLLDRADDWVLVKVTDNGVGIPEDKLDVIFVAFAQADGSARRRHEGSGLGLTVAARLAQLMGGTLTAESDGVGRGATFRLVLPVR